MKHKEKKAIVEWANSLSDADLEKEYYNSVYDCLGSEAEEMYERGYDEQDIKEREKYEKWLAEKSDILEVICEKRGIKLWQEPTEKEDEGK